MTNDLSRATALDEIAATARAHDLTIDDIAAHMLQQDKRSPAAKTNILTAMLGYFGGLLVFTGLGYLVAQQWDDLGDGSRILITFGPGLITLALALACLRDARFIRAVTPLFLIAALMQPLGLFTALAAFFSGNDGALASIVVFTPMAAQMLLLFARLKRTALLFLGLIFSFAVYAALLHKAGIDGDLAAVTLGLSGLLLSAGINRTPYRAFTPFTYFLNAVVFATGCWALLENSFADAALIAIGGLMIFASIKVQSRSFLTASVLTMLGYLCYYTNEYFADMLGWSLALIVIGLFMIGLSAWAIKLGRAITPYETP